MSDPTPARTQAERADQTRTRILEAAIHQFSQNGLAGARTEQIAEAAGVNKALLYYYFKSKQDLYQAALEWMAERVAAGHWEQLKNAGSPGECFLIFVLSHFDRMHSQRDFQSLMQQEMVRLHRGEPHALSPIIERVFRPGLRRMFEVLEEGIAAGELIAVDPRQIYYSTLGANVFYFLSAPLFRLLGEGNPVEHAALVQRRIRAIEFLGQSLFVDREHGAQVAARVLAAVPMPADGGHAPRTIPEFRKKNNKHAAQNDSTGSEDVR